MLYKYSTSSTAQGGGGSFKNRKPIGEVGCCESRMAEWIHWWTERWLECRAVHLSIYDSIHPSIHLSFFTVYWSISLSTYPSLCLSVHLLSSLSVYAAVLSSSYFFYVSICLSFFLFLSFELCPFPCLSVCLSSCGLSIYLAVYLLIQLSILSIYVPKHFTHPSIEFFIFPSRQFDRKQVTFAQKRHRAIKPGFQLWFQLWWQQRDFLNFRSWQEQKRSNSARLPHFSKVTTSKTKPFSETSFKTRKLSAELTASCVLRSFQSMCLKYCADEKVMPSHTKCCTRHAKSSQQTWRSDAPKCNPSQEISALTSEQLWWTCLLYCACRAKDILPDPLQMSHAHACHRFRKCYKPLTFCSLLSRCIIPCACQARRRLNIQKCSEHVSFLHFWLRNVLHATTACAFLTSQLSKVVRAWCALCILTYTCASRHNGVHFFDMSTSKSGPRMLCFVHFDLKMRFAPQRRALFRHLNVQKWSENGVLCAFWLGNVLRATMACTFSTSQLPKVVRTWCQLRTLTWKCASCHNSVQLFISYLATWLRTRRFREPTFRLSGDTNHWKHSVSRAPASSSFWLFLFSDSILWLFSPLLFHLSILSEVWQLPSIKCIQTYFYIEYDVI